MVTYDALIKKDDLINRKEHCSVDREKLESVGRLLGHQVRIKRNNQEYALYTVSEVRQEDPDKIVRMGEGGLKRLDPNDEVNEFNATLDPQVPHPALEDPQAVAKGEFVERLDDNGWHNGLIAIAPHGGDIEPDTDAQAEHVAFLPSAKGVSLWRCKGWHRNGAFEHWHITSTDIHEACFPLLNSVISRGFRYAVAFHGFKDDDIEHHILIGGLASDALKEKIKAAIKAAVGSEFSVHITTPDDQFGGDDKRNIVNRLTAGGANGIQIEQKEAPRKAKGLDIAEAVAQVYASEL